MEGWLRSAKVEAVLPAKPKRVWQAPEYESWRAVQCVVVPVGNFLIDVGEVAT